MKKLLSLLVTLTFVLSLCACGGTDVTGANYTISIPEGFEKAETDAGVEWKAKDYEETEYEIHVTDVGIQDYTNDTIPATFEEWSEDNSEEGTSYDKIFFEYNAGDKYEEYTMVYKATYTEGSLTYSMAKTDYELENIDLDNIEDNKEVPPFPNEIEICYGKKVLVDKIDRSKVIIAVANSNDLADAAEIQTVLESFNWK